MKTIVLGGGFIGLTTAYFLAKEGHQVELVERHQSVAGECSFSNAAQLSYCHAEPWASTETLLNGLKWIGKSDAPLLFKFRFDLQMWLWIFNFLKFCNAKCEIKNTEKILKLGLYSRKVLHEIESGLNFDFNYQKSGKVFIFNNQKDYKNYLKQTEIQKSFGSQHQILSYEEVLQYEPALKNKVNNYVGFIRDPLDESADGYKFSLGLHKKLVEMGVKFHFNTSVEDFILQNNKVKSVITNQGALSADNFVFCLGAYSPIFSKKLGINLPIYPIKGYSITYNVTNPDESPQTSITNYKEKTVYSRLGDKVRVAGTAEFAGYNHYSTKARIEMMKNSVRRFFPDSGDIDAASEWACLRPSTPDSVPIIGKSKFNNLYFNTGHGTLGWTQNFSSAKLITDIILERKTELNEDWYNLRSK